MNWETYLDELYHSGIMLWPDGDNLAFEAPEEALTLARLQTLKAHKRDILHFLRHATTQYPLSYGQQALWFEHQMVPNGFAYNVSLSLRIHSLVEPAKLEYAFQLLVNRHPTLRTTFPLCEGEPAQQVRRFQEVILSEIEASQWTEQELKERVSATHGLPFNLAQGPLFRLSLFTRQVDDHILLFTLHHLICDGWSIWLLLDELRTLFTAVLSDEPAALPALQTTYHDYVAWQADVLQENDEKLWGYWQKALAGELPLLDLPTDEPRPAVRTYQGASQPFEIPDELTRQLAALARRCGVTLYMVLLAAFQILLQRYTGQDDILVGSPIAGRSRPEFASMVGYFTNPVVMRADLSKNLSFREFLGQVRQTVLGAFEHQEFPFPLLVQRLQPPRVAGVSAIFQSMFTLQRAQTDPQIMELMTGATTEPRYFGGLYLSPFPLPLFEGQFDLSLELVHRSTALTGALKYNPELFVQTTIERMIAHLQTLLQSIVADPSQGVHELPLLTAAERHKILVEWNDTKTDYPSDKCIHQLFEEQVERTPEAIAVVFQDQQLTYRELNTRANQLAHYLIAQGVGPDVLVGICIPRSVEMVIGLLGILKAGGAYVPLDPNYPVERLAFMFSDAQVKLTLTQTELHERLSVLTEPSMLDLTSQWPPSERSGENPTTEVKPNNLAYVIYTSGSTGQPKGVQICHRAICNHMLWIQNTFAFAASDKVLQKTPFSFDASVWEFYGPLLVGGQLVIARPRGHQDSSYMLSILQSQKITILQLVPTQLRMLVEAGGLSHCDSLKHLFCGGEALPLELVRRFKSLNEAQVTNLYGPTEACIDATFWQAKDESQIVPIGRPIANCQAYILDLHLQPVPIGVAGELHLGGAGLARGYKGRPELTSEKFIPNPFGEGRLYKTGDLCRYLPDGNIEFLRRADYQVKIRGFRIELGEIEALLSQHSAMQEVVVVVRSDVGKRLVAYFVAQEPISSSTLRAYLGEKLPDYMIPSVFQQLEVMPLTPNGKINRRALPALDIGVDQAQLVLPRTAVERILAAIWQEVLGLKQVGVTDNFFEIGGDSIISMQIVSRAKEAGIQLTVKELFQHQTIAQLATVAKSVETSAAEQGIVTGTFPLTPIQHWFLEQKQDRHHYNQSVLLELTSQVNPKWLLQALDAWLIHHDALRLRFEHQEGSWRQAMVAPSQSVSFEVIGLDDSNVSILQKANQLQASFNLSEGPLLRVALFESSTVNRLLIVIHHLAVDGVSWRILLEDLQRAYQQLASGEPIQLPAKTTSFKEWATRLNQKGPSTVEAEREYWRQLKASFKPLPIDYQSGANDNASALTISTRLDWAHTQALLNEVPAVYQTQINDLLLTALLLTFQRWTGEASLLLELEGHGREELFEVDLSRTVGWFTTIFPVRLTLTTSDLGAAIKDIKEQLRQIPNRGIGYGILRYLSPVQIPEVKAQVLFNYFGQFDQVASGPLIKGLASESSGVLHSPSGSRTELLSINSMVVEGQLQVDWTYSQNFHRAQTIQQLANRFIDTLQALIAHCQEPEAGGYTPSDFSRVSLSQDELDDLLAEFGD